MKLSLAQFADLDMHPSLCTAHRRPLPQSVHPPLHPSPRSGISSTLPRRTYATIAGGGGLGDYGASPIDLDLPPAHNLDERHNYFM